MNNDTQITHHAYWIMKGMMEHVEEGEYKDIIDKDLPIDILNEIEALVAHIKEQY